MEVNEYWSKVQARYKFMRSIAAKIDYKVMKDLGATKEMGDCKAWKNEHGYQYFFVYLKLNKRMTIEWSPEDKMAVLTKVDSSESIITQIPMESEQQLRTIVDLFKRKEGPLEVHTLNEHDAPVEETLYA